MTTKEQNSISLWICYIPFFWGQVRFVPIIEAGVLVGWYALESKGHTELANALLGLGSLLLLIMALILFRLSQWLNTFRQGAGDLIPKKPRISVSLLPASWLAILTTVILIVVNLSLLRVNL